MKKIKVLLVLFLFTLMCLPSCKEGVEHYEMVGGDPKIDYIDFVNDSVCKFVAPGPLDMTTKYRKEGDTYTVTIQGFINAHLYRVDKKTLKGEPPFFEGTWVRK